MKEDLLIDARKRVVERAVSMVEVPQAELLTFGEKLREVFQGGSKDLVNLSAGAGVGTLLGVHTGFAFLGTAVSGAWVLAPLLGLATLVVGRTIEK